MFKSLIFLTSFSLWLLLSCSGRNEEESPLPVNPKDSIEISGLFQKASLPGSNEDSLIRIANAKVAENPSLYDVFQYNSLRNDIMKGRLDKAGEELTLLYSDYENDSLNYKWAKYLNLLASVAAYKNQQNDAVKYFQKALVIYEKSKDELQSSAIRYNLSNIFLSRTDYETANSYAQKAHENLVEVNDTLYLPLVKALLAVTTLHTSRDYKLAESYANEALELSEKHNNIQGLLLARYAIGEKLAKLEEYEEAIGHLIKALELGEKYQHTQILVSGGASLLTCYLGLKDYDKAISHGLKTIKISKNFQNADIEYSLNKNLGKSYAGKGDYTKAFTHMQIAEQLYRGKSNKENQEVIHNLLISYETEKKNNIILSQENKIQNKRTWIMGLASLSTFILGALIFTQRLGENKRKMLQAQSEKEVLQALTDGEERERTRIAGELHDGVGSQLIAAKLSLENIDDWELYQQPLQLIKNAHSEVRMVAHNLMPVDFNNNSLAVAVKEFCERSSSDNLQVRYISNAYDDRLPKNTAHGLYRAIQELVQNAVKHAHAKGIFVQFLKTKDTLHVSIEDDGVGIEAVNTVYADSFQFLKKRIEKLGAGFELTSTKGKGTVARIIIKLSEK